MATMKKNGIGIRRRDNQSNRTHAWTVTIQRRGRIFHKYFSDGVHGGRKAAYRAAVAYRDGLVQRCRPIIRGEFAQIKKRSNRSGHVGIGKYSVRTAQGKRIRAYWIATWTPERGVPARQRKFSIAKYGERKAFLLAKHTRARAVAALRGAWRL
jgi:hypothetical protein